MLSRPKSTIARTARAFATLALAAVVAMAGSVDAFAQNVPVVRDAEIEALVRDYARPIFKAAGLSGDAINIVLVNDQSFNAFVAGRRMFINTGALMTAETPNEIIGVIAHEAGHIAGGHQQKLREQLERAKTMAILATLLGAGAMVAGATSNSRGLAGAGMGVMAGGGEMAQRSILAYQRTEEMTADRSAIAYLNATGQSGMGMLKTFGRFQNALSLSGAQVDPYRISHPMPQERIANLEVLVKQSPYVDKVDPPALQQRHDMMRIKIAAYMQGQAAASRLMRKNPGSLASRYGDAQMTYLFGNLASALTKTNALIKEQPKNPYFQELRGDILMKANRPKDAADAYAKAVSLDPARSGLLPVSYGQALMAIGTEDSLKKAVAQINTGLGRDRENADGYRYLAQAYGELGNIPAAELATAEGHFYSGDYKNAKIFAMRAQQSMKRGEPGWLRAQDIINYAPSGKKK
ncbi:M48 family metalloprotease [Mesorhizobium sp. LMG 17147]|uniref:M48 family metalloprotease n=1 Tax=Mesorhizobium sp. LMG 17147 TaxID=2963091 RepID=UPI0020C9E3F5|nr:M48 family metalloprotease [Mesorhizobium sp. LMG 17147]MCP9230112.1 M48 family metalloprotease [Mesorhizobium sp. LMG 17147]